MAFSDEFIFPGLVTLMHCYQMATFAIAVGALRKKHNVNPPEVTGPDEFNRGFRAQQNCVEFMPIFLALLWLASAFFNQYVAAGLGLVYVVARQRYFYRYIEKAGRRYRPFKWASFALRYLSYVVVAGLVHAVLMRYVGLDLASLARARLTSVLGPMLPKSFEL